MAEYSVLFKNPAERLRNDQVATPEFFTDLNLDQIVAAVITGKEAYDLAPFFALPLHDADAVLYRQEVMRDLEMPHSAKTIATFAEHMGTVREQLAHAADSSDSRQSQRWLLDGATEYVRAVQQLATGLAAGKPVSRGLQACQRYLASYMQSEQFTQLAEQSRALQEELGAIRYEVLIEGLRVEIRYYQGEPNYSTEIQDIFRRFSQEAGTRYEYGFRERTDLNQVEGRILDLVAESHRDIFGRLATFAAEHKHFLDSTVVRFDREVQFYVAYLDYISGLKKAGLPFCYPTVSGTNKVVHGTESFDLALAGKLHENGDKPVANDFYLQGHERIIVVSGPNQGGKTTFARMFGQLHYLASLGCPVPGADANLYLPDTLFTHFEREENMTDLRGKLEDDLLRMHAILQVATPRSIILINEIFTSTTLQDAISLSEKIAAAIMRLDLLCVWVTFIDEVASLGKQTVSMVSTVVPGKPAVRTFKVVRRPADGVAYALSIAEKYHLTSSMIKKRIAA